MEDIGYIFKIQLIVLGLVDFHFLLSILCMLSILSRLIRATISVFVVPCFLFCCHVIWFYLELNNK